MTRVTLSTDRIDLIDKYNTWCHIVRLAEQITHTARTDTDEHLHELRTGQRKERNIRLTGNCLGKQRLTGSRRSYKQGTLRQLRTDL